MKLDYALGYVLLALIIGGFPVLCAFGAYKLFSRKWLLTGFFVLLAGAAWAWLSYEFMFNVKGR
jgi:hypothetical protein